MSTRGLAFLVMIAACSKASAPTPSVSTLPGPTPPSGPVDAGVEAAASPSSSLPPDAATAAACPTAEPVLQNVSCVLENHEPRNAGYSRTGKWFGHCVVDGHVAGQTCDFVNTKTGEKKHFETEIFFDEKPRPKQLIERFLEVEGFAVDGTRAPLTSPWPYADMKFAIRTELKGAEKPIIRFGATVLEEEPVFPIVFELSRFPAPPRPKDETQAHWDEMFNWFHGDITQIQVSLDGSELGVVARVNGTHFTEQGDSKRMLVKTFAGRVYNDSGMRFHAKGNWKSSAEMFKKATDADQNAERLAYNLACANARLDNAADSEAALRKAIRLGGESVKARAAKDEDFASVRSAPWFKAVIGR